MVRLAYKYLSNFNPRSPYGERRKIKNTESITAEFQSTLPLRGATNLRVIRRLVSIFQSTLPLRGATLGSGGTYTYPLISIHAPLTGSDPPGLSL